MSQADITSAYVAVARYLAESMVPEEDRDQINVSSSVSRGQLEVRLHIPDKYRGMFIGRSGHMVRSLRHVLAAADLDAPSTVSLDIV